MSTKTVKATEPVQKSMDPFSKPYILTQDQLDSFEKNGYLILSNLIPSEMLQQVQLWSCNVQSLPNEKGKWMHYEQVKKDGSRTLCRTENCVNYHHGFNFLLRGQRIRSLLESLSGEEMLLFKEKINYKDCAYSSFFSTLCAISSSPISLPLFNSWSWWL